jgi:hypothetical protein
MIDRRMMQIQRIILVIMIVTKPDTLIIMISATGTELIEKEDCVKWKMSLERDKIIGKHDRRRVYRNIYSEASGLMKYIV